MTAILGWQDGADAFLVANTAVTRRGPARWGPSGFGEVPLAKQLVVEEGAIKLLELPRGVVAGVAGDARTALEFVRILERDLHQTPRSLTDLVEEVAAIFDQHARFEILLAHRECGATALLHVTNRKPYVTACDRGVQIIGSMAPAKRSAVETMVERIRAHGLPPAARHAAVLVFLQAGGITEYLFEQGIGGTFFGVRRSAEGVEWQPDVVYFVYPPTTFGHAPVVTDDETDLVTYHRDDLGTVRVLVRQGAGIVLSSLGNPGRRAFLPPTSGRSIKEWQSIVLEAVPPPFEQVVPSDYYGFLNAGHRKAAFCAKLAPADEPAVAVLGNVGNRRVALAARFVQTLEDTPPPGHFDYSVVVEDAHGTTCMGYRLNEAGFAERGPTQV
jgi:hypothetical protein